MNVPDCNHIGRNDEAKKTLLKLRQVEDTDADFIAEFDEIVSSVQAELAIGTASWKELTEPSVFIRVGIACMLIQLLFAIVFLH